MGMARGGEKAKDLIGTWKKLLGYCRRYRVALVAALLCAVLGTVLTLAGPDKLSDMTDTITAGIAPDQAMLETVTDTVSQTLTDNLEAVTQATSAGLGDQAQLTQKAGAILASPDFTPAEKQAFQETLAGLAGALLGAKYTAFPTLGTAMTNKAFISSVFGGLGSIPGAVLGAITLGIGETMISSYISSSMRDIFAYALLVIVLFVRPSGLMGKATEDKA